MADERFSTTLHRNNWGDYSLTKPSVERLNAMAAAIEHLQSDVAILVDTVLRQDAETAELRAWIADLEAKQLTMDTDITQMRPTWGPLLFGGQPPVGRTATTTTGIRIATDIDTGGTHGSTT